MYLAPDFRPFLEGQDLDDLEASDNTVVGLRDDLTIGYVNGAWARFAEEAGAEPATPLGHVLEAFAEPLRPFYRELFQRVRREGEPEVHTYECSSPERFRQFQLRVIPLAHGGLLLIHHRASDRPHDRLPHPADPSVYRDEHGLLTQCAHCRMVRRVDNPSTWDWVPELVQTQAEHVSHGLCPVCFRHYYPDLAEAYDRKVKGRRKRR